MSGVKNKSLWINVGLRSSKRNLFRVSVTVRKPNFVKESLKPSFEQKSQMSSRSPLW